MMSAIKTPTFERWSTKDPTKGLILPEHQIRQVLVHRGPDTAILLQRSGVN